MSDEEKDNTQTLNEALYWAIKGEELKKAVQLLSQGAEINAPAVADWTPLAHAADLGHLAIVKMLLERGAEVNLCDNDGLSPLHWAKERGHLEVAKLLIEHGAE